MEPFDTFLKGLAPSKLINCHISPPLSILLKERKIDGFIMG